MFVEILETWNYICEDLKIPQAWLKPIPIISNLTAFTFGTFLFKMWGYVGPKNMKLYFWRSEDLPPAWENEPPKNFKMWGYVFRIS